MKGQSCEIAKIHLVSGKFLETSIKVASSIQASKDMPDYDVSSDIDDLLICLIAHMRIIQEEHCMLLVGGNYGPCTQQIFRAIHANPNQYTPSVIKELKTSAALAALPPEVPPNNRNFPRSGRENHEYRSDFRGGNRFHSFRARGCGFYHGNQFTSHGTVDNNPGFRP